MTMNVYMCARVCVCVCTCVCIRVYECVIMYMHVCVRVFTCLAVHVGACACFLRVPCACQYVHLVCMYVLLCQAGSHLLPDGTNMFLATGKDGETKIHEVSADIEFVGLQVAC